MLKPQKFCDFYCGEDDIFLIGEAAGFISASSFEGISYAIRSGYLLAKAFEEEKILHEYRKRTLKMRYKLYSKIWKAKILDNYLFRTVLLKSGLGSLKSNVQIMPHWEDNPFNSK